MSTTDTAFIPEEVKAQLRQTLDDLARGVRSPDAMKAACERMDRMREQAHRDGYVETLFGRRLHLDYINSRNQAQRSGAERAAINAPMQGTAADIIKRAMIAVDAWLIDQDEAARMLLQVHDELVFEVREDRVDAVSAAIRERMADAANLAVPLVVDICSGENWDEAH